MKLRSSHRSTHATPTVRTGAVLSWVLLTLAFVTTLPPDAEACHFASHYRLMEERMGMTIPEDVRPILHLMESDGTQLLSQPIGATPCVDGMAAGFPCRNVDLMAALPMSSIGGSPGNDLWGWTDPVTGREWAIMGRENGTAFVDVTDPANPVYVANLPTETISETWRDMKVYEDHVFIVADFTLDHGMQVFDLTELRDITSPPVTLGTSDLAALYEHGGWGSAHNIVINEDTGFAYIVGESDGAICGSGLHMVDIQDPANPTFAGCFSADGYTHDAQCVLYDGPDTEHVGSEICFAANTDTLTIVDVTNKSVPAQLSRTTYQDEGYTHQGWLTPDHRYFLIDDELDEISTTPGDDRTRTYVWDIADLDDPTLIGVHFADGDSTDHNQYIKDDLTYQANYQRGLRMLSLVSLETATLSEVAFFDTYPDGDGTGFQGAWSVYPYFESGTVIVSDRNRGLFVLRPDLEIFEDGFESGDASHWDQSVQP